MTTPAAGQAANQGERGLRGSPHAPGRTLLHTRTIVDETALAAVVLARRKPLLLLRLSGVFLLRLAERRFVGLLFQEPPRSTRFLHSPLSHALPLPGAPE